MTPETIPPMKTNAIKRAAICSAVILTGFILMGVMSRMKEPPLEKKVIEKKLSVKTLSAKKQDVKINISAYGEVASLNTVTISTEVTGLITGIHPKLEEGEMIPAGDVLFTIDAADYETAYETYKKRQVVLTGNMKLAEKEYLRVKKLYEKNNTGTLSDVETAEYSFNTAIDTLAQVTKLLKDAEKNIERCTVKTPFNARVKTVDLEKGQYVVSGNSLVTIADDSVLELIAPVTTSEALMVVEFLEQETSFKGGSWFRQVKQNPCEVIWSESGNTLKTEGILHRVVKYDSTNRTVSLAIRIEKKMNETVQKDLFPIVDGMFCKVVIPGKTMTDVIKLPDSAISYDGKVKLASEGRLKTVQVDTLWKGDGFSLISGGLDNGDNIITTRLSSPLENTRLEVSETVMVADGTRG